jgi:hypothetical protein
MVSFIIRDGIFAMPVSVERLVILLVFGVFVFFVRLHGM